LHPIRADPSNASLKDISLHNRQATDSHNARLLQPGLLKVSVPLLNQLIESLDLLVQLRRNHTDQPIVVGTRSFANQQSRAKLAHH
jgi:hypothetical protein